MKPTLFILAAGMGSRYGGLKQLDGVGPSGETIMDYSVYDAIRAGFGKVVFVIRHDFEADFREKVLSKYAGVVDTEVVFQDIDSLPDGRKAPEGRTKPWGTGHAVLMGRDAIREPFAVINADDFYGADSFRILADFLSRDTLGKGEYCMVGFRIGNTLSENGTVSRGSCAVDGNDLLTSVTECHGIERTPEGIVYDLPEGGKGQMPEDTWVSMNMWGFTPDYFDYSEGMFRDFLAEHGDEMKSEFYIPTVVNNLIADGRATLKVERTPSQWFGVTYAADRDATVARIRDLVKEGIYPEKLF